jgi:group I intron endonuclease
MYIYCITNKTTGKKYVGKCKHTPEESKNYYGSGILIKKEICNLGRENFTKEILEENLTSEIINEREKYWIRELRTKSPEGYNLTDGGGGVINLSQESKERQKEKLRELKGPLNSRYGKKNSSEHNEAIKKANIGKLKKPETLEKLRQANLGKKLSIETISKMLKSRQGYKTSQETRYNIGIGQPTTIKVNQLDKKTGELLDTYYSLGEASRKTGIKTGNISMCLSGKTKSAGGYKWEKAK